MKKAVGILFIINFILIFSHPVHALVSNLERVDIHGFISQGYLQSTENNFLADTKDGSFQFNEMGINFSTNIAKKLQLGIQFFARDLGDLGNDKIVVDWAFADYRWEDWLGIVVGKIKLPKGLYNETKDIDMLRTFVLLPQSVYKAAWRDTLTANKGVGIYGKLPVNMLGSINYQFQSGVVNIETVSGVAKSIEATDPDNVDVTGFDVSYTNSGSLVWDTPFSGLRIGGSIVNIAYDVSFVYAGVASATLEDDLTVTVGSVEYMYAGLTFAAEYLEMRREYKETLTNIPDTITSQGYYASLAYRYSKFLEIGTYYSEYYTDKDDKDGEDYAGETNFPDHTVFLKDFAQSIRLDLNDNWIFKFEHHLMDGTDIMYPQDNLDDGTKQRYSLFAAKMTFSF